MKAEVHIDLAELADLISTALLQELTSQLLAKPHEEDALFTVDTLATYLNVSKQWVYERVRLKEIPHIKVGRLPRFRKSDIDRWLETSKIPASSPLSVSSRKRLLKAIEKTR